MATENVLGTFDENYLAEITKDLPDQGVLEVNRFRALSKGARDAQMYYAAIFLQDTFIDGGFNPDNLEDNAAKILRDLPSWQNARLADCTTTEQLEGLSAMDVFSVRRIARLNLGYFYVAMHSREGVGFRGQLELWHNYFSASLRAAEMFDEILQKGL